MPANPDFAALAARAEAGGDATLSDDVWRALGWRQGPNPWEQDQIWQSPPQPGPVGGGWRSLFSGPRPDLCTSIDAQAALPGRVVRIELHEASDIFPEIWTAGVELSLGWIGAEAPTEALARLAALLRAMTAKDPADAR